MTAESKTLLVLTVGTTEPPLAKAIDDTEPPCHLLLLYGRSLKQAQAPIEVAARLRQRAQERGLTVQETEVSDPEDLTLTLEQVRTALRPLLGERWARLRFNITGGTKVLSGALLHLAHQVTDSPVEVEYTGGAERDDTGRVVGSMRTTSLPLWRQHAWHALDLLRQRHYAAAFAWAEVLPGAGKAGFVRNTLDALAQWDRMEYSRAYASLSAIRGLEYLTEDAELEPLVRLLERIRSPAGQVRAALERLDDSSKLSELDPATLPPFVLEGLRLLALDALENARRRLDEGRYADVTLRTYRAVEIASQRGLLLTKFSPWKPGEEMALAKGLQLLAETEDSLPWEDILCDTRTLQSARNYSFLEHGYTAVSSCSAESSLRTATGVVSHLLGLESSDAATQASRPLSFDMEDG